MGIKHNFGGKVFSRSGPNDLRGTRSVIQAPSGVFTLAPGTAGAMRVSAEYYTGSTNKGLIQTGYAASYGVPIDDCGVPSPSSPNQPYRYWETIQLPGGTPNAKCGWLQLNESNGAHLYTVYRQDATQAGNSTTWIARIDGTNYTSRNTLFDGAMGAVAGGELLLPGFATYYPDGTVYGCYGCAVSPLGAFNWQWTSYAASTGWADITSAVNITAPTYASDNKWTVGSLPGPFVVQHTCDPGHAYGC